MNSWARCSLTLAGPAGWYSSGRAPNGFDPEDEGNNFIDYLALGGDLELFRGTVDDRYEAKLGARAA